VAHALEHVAFRRTQRWESEEMLDLIEATGGELNAYTSAESIAFETYVPYEFLDLGVEVLGELVVRARLADADLERERPVLAEEHSMADDEFAGLCAEALVSAMLGPSGLGRPVRGTAEGIAAMTGADLRRFRDRQFFTEDLVVAAAGRVDHGRLVALVDEHFADLSKGTGARPEAAEFAGQGHTFLERDTDQVYVAVGWPALAAADSRQPALDLALWALGGGMSSRLARDLREDQGLVYSIGSWNSTFVDVGLIGVSTGCAPENLKPVLDGILRHAESLRRTGLDDAELHRAIGSVAGQLRLEGDSIEGRLSRLVGDEFTFGRIVPIDETTRSYVEVGPADILGVLNEVLGVPPHVAIVGPAAVAGIL
jgi:predicted Zn-dependent peptidase